MKRSRIFLLFVGVFFLFFVPNMAQIHRAASKQDYQIKYDSNYTAHYLLKQLNLESNNSRLETAQTILTRLFGFKEEKLLVWASTVIGTFFVGICGIVPVLILPQLADDHNKLVKSAVFTCLVAFAAGSLIGDVFIHLLPEAYSKNVSDHEAMNRMGLWVLFGMLAFLSVEKLFPDDDGDEDENKNENESNRSNQTGEMIAAPSKKGNKRKSKKKKSKSNQNQIEKNQITIQAKKGFRLFESVKTIGILNAVANIVDNFTHGIAVAGSFQASFKFGVMTLIATLLHEIPHEIGDFVILLKSGLNYRQAAIAQLTTAFSGILGAIFALNWSTAEEAGNVTCWILPFTSGGFLYIALVNIVPELLREKDPWLSLKQLVSLIVGVLVIFLFNHLFE